MGDDRGDQAPAMDGAAISSFDADPARRVGAAGQVSGGGLERSSFTAIYRTELAWVAATLRRLGVPATDLPDAAQKVFTEVWKQRASYQSERPIRPWLFAFAYRVVGDHQRGAWRRRAVFEEVDVAREEAGGAEERLDAARNRQLVLDALGALDFDRRAAFVTMDIEGMSAPDAAVALGIPLGTAYSRLRLAREDFSAAVKRLRLKRGER